MLLEESVKVGDAVECVYDEGDDTGLRSRQDFYGHLGCVAVSAQGLYYVIPFTNPQSYYSRGASSDRMPAGCV